MTGTGRFPAETIGAFPSVSLGMFQENDLFMVDR
jgi:hypothetical protein